MKYKVKITSSAQADILRSIEWGVPVWGRTAAVRWATELRTTINRRLKVFPLGCPVAPDQVLTGLEVRQLIVGRYRVLFEVDKRLVRILHVRGPFVGDPADENEELE